MTSVKSVKTKNIEANIVIIGGGGSGLAAAVSAAENGATGIVVLEKRAPGGNSAFAFCIFAADSPVQKRQNIDCTRDACYKLAMNFAHWRINPRIIRAFIDKSGKTIQWLEGKGLEFFCTVARQADHMSSQHMIRGGGALIIKTLLQECKDKGVQVLSRTPAVKILKSANGNVTGVLAEKNGKKIRISADRVIIATGGFAGNKKLLREYCPYYYDDMICDGIPHAGDGLEMAVRAGAARDGHGALNASAPCAPRTAFVMMDAHPEKIRISLKAIAGEPYSIWVNKNGIRFTDECITFYHYEAQNAFAIQPDKVAYSLYDSSMMQTMISEGTALGLGMPWETPWNNTTETAKNKIRLPDLARALQQRVKNKIWVKVSDSWGEIARWIGADPTVLKATIDEYNRACELGRDPVFAKDPQYLRPLRNPPYFAVEGRITYVTSIGGIKINERMAVLDRNDNPIPGLYAAGVDTGGWESETYCSRISGHAFGFTINSGRIAGESAAEDLRKMDEACEV